MSTTYILGRMLLSALFIVLGIQKFLSVDDLAKMLTGYVPLPAEIDQYLGGMSRFIALAYLVAAIETICAILVFLGFATRWAALVLIVYVASTIFFVHNFWDMEGAVAVANRMAVLMNLSIVGGLMLIASGGAGPGATDRR